MLELKGVTKIYYIDKKPFYALKDINLYFPKQQFCSILGASGSGKTTTLNIIGGLDKYSEGDLIIEGQSTKTYRDEDWDNYRNKRIGFVFQSYNLIPHLSIIENVEMGLTLSGVSKKIRSQKAKKALDSVGLKGLYNKKPNQLSGGQMQRVTIARAILNDPEIILADEPTGALDSVTSVQILNLLKEVSKSRLVIMVTHNRDLAEKYSDRIVEFKDGEVLKDSLASKIKEIQKEEDAEYSGGASLKTFEIIDEKKNKFGFKKKKKKSSMSFGTSLNISFKNLLTKKGRTIMTSVAGSFGIIGVALVLSVNNGFGDYINRLERETANQMPLNVSSYSVTYEKDPNFVENEQYTDKEIVLPYKSNQGTAKISYNNITDKYINYLDYLKDDEKIINDYIVTYSDEYALNLTTTNPATGKAYKVTNGNYVAYSDMISSLTGLPTNFFHVLYGDETSYDIIEGRFADPNNKNELMLMVDSRNQIPLKVLKELGFYDKDDDTIDVNYATENPVSFNEIMSKTYKVFPNSEYYTENHKSIDMSDKEAYYYTQNDVDSLFNDESKGIECKIVGILRTKKSSSIQSMASGLCYQKSLQNYIISLNNQDSIYQNIKNNVTWKKGKSASDFIKELGNYTDLLNGGSVTSTSSISSSINSLINEYFSFYSIFTGESTNTSGTAFKVSNYLSWCEKIGADIVDDELKVGGLTTLTEYLTKIIASINKYALLTTRTTPLYESYPYIVSSIGYINTYSSVQGVIIFPVDLTTKEKLTKKLDEFNEIDSSNVWNHAVDSSEVVTYTDIIGTLTGTMTEMINILSIVLIVFASISLVVSCVMTGIITYVSVVERTKEIGILRALGARKHDVGALFEAECVFIGIGSGAVGCLVAYIATFPINAIINALYSEYNIGNIASLNYVSVIVLICISVVLSFFSSLLPARKAAKKDPVTALRSE